jgi:hypothetical protein
VRGTFYRAEITESHDYDVVARILDPGIGLLAVAQGGQFVWPFAGCGGVVGYG